MFPPKNGSQTPSGPPMGAGKPTGNPPIKSGKPGFPPKKKAKKKSRQTAMDAIGALGLPGYGPNDA